MIKRLSGVIGPVLALLLASCGGGAAPASSSAPSSSAASAKPAASAPASSASAAPASASASAGASTAASAGAAATGPIKIGLLQPQTGVFASQGKDHLDGFKLYLDSIKSTAAGRQIQLLSEDDQATPDVALAKAKQLVEQDKIQILAGGSITPECFTLAPYVQSVKIPFVNTGNCVGIALTVDPKYANPYLFRVSATNPAQAGPLADYVLKNGIKKVDLVSLDYVAGLEVVDAFSYAFVKRGGTIIQEQYPDQSTTDFGPYLSKLNQNADAVFSFLPGVTGLRFMQQFENYADPKKIRVLDYGGGITAGANLAQLKTKAVGTIIASTSYLDTLDNPANQAFIKAWNAAYPGRLPSADANRGYDGAMYIVAAINAAKGNVEDTSPDGAFMKALTTQQVDGARGKIKLDADRDVVQTTYIYDITPSTSSPAGVGYHVLATYPDESKDFDLTRDQLLKFPFGKMKGKWTNMTADQAKALVS